MKIVPDFDSGSSAGRKLAIICSKGNLDMAYPGLILGNAALGEGVETHLFFTFWGFDMIIKSRAEHLQFSPAGNTALHIPGTDLHMPQAFAPAMTGMATSMLKNNWINCKFPRFPISWIKFQALEDIYGHAVFRQT